MEGGRKVFAGQREEAFFVDLGAIFDLGTLRPFQNLHLIPTPAADGVDATKGFNVHTIALQVPKTELTRDDSEPTDPMNPSSVIGIWATASRQRASVREPKRGAVRLAGPWVQVSRLGMPLINEVIIPLGNKDRWNASEPEDDEQFLRYYLDPELQNLLPVLYPGVFPNLAALLGAPPASRPRNDLLAILLTGIPAGLIPEFQNFTGSTPADMLRLNLAIPPTTVDPSPLGILGDDLGGFPNGRRVFDDVVAIELRAIAGLTYPLIDPTFTPDSAAAVLADGTANDVPPLRDFPYIGHPHEGYEHEHD
ncbi:DUF4331 domain-containing protein [Thermomicrobiaceae bacterium CFH 74404]|uniref:DUF4331 domain-containing protein n=1 Tax=Thermalbibacter longus TaxID=2951981 RepID=A0AA41WGA3_9BACT|nr:DUF4331 domain-containing protein [Thermalbibacter longus]MCM8749578.1 DUF4331 domain-containing protein [Thermalbibacter longus]